MYTDIIYITSSYKYTLYIEVAHTNCFTSSLNTYIGKTPVFNFNILSSHPSTDRKLY